MSIRIGIALGSNLGDRMRNLRLARERILASPVFASDGACLCASVYQTEPVGCEPGTPDFLNTVLELGTSAAPDPLLLLRELQTIEEQLGRPAGHPRNAPRSIDLDLLYVGEGEFRSRELTLPHPSLSQRRFVLEPLAEIRPHLDLPGSASKIADLLRACADTSRVAPILSIW